MFRPQAFFKTMNLRYYSHIFSSSISHTVDEVQNIRVLFLWVTMPLVCDVIHGREKAASFHFNSADHEMVDFNLIINNRKVHRKFEIL